MILKLSPLAFTKVWGGDKLLKIYDMPLTNIGEIWGISAHKSNSNIIINGQFKGITFRELFTKHRELFGNYPKDEFPLLLKVIDAKEDLSIQVHPDNEYARTNEDSFGKDECWYILEADEKSRIQIGHRAKNRNEMKNAILNNSLEEILLYNSISVGDYYYIPSGKVHAICKNTTLLEVSQSSDITYRLYDYNRLDNGKLRTLHIQNSLDVISFPDTKNETKHSNKYFTFNIIDFHDERIKANVYGDYLYVVDGIGTVDDENISKGDFFVITSNSEYKIHGRMKIAQIRINLY
jgi:mannose-6-phosphate isomerase class I